MKRRELITLLGAAAAWPLASRAQQTEQMRRIGVLIPAATDDKIFQARLAALLQGLQQLGWSDGRNLRIDIRWGAGDADLIRKHAVELVALAPDVVISFASISAAVTHQTARHAIRDQAAVGDEVIAKVDRWELVPGRQRDDQRTMDCSSRTRPNWSTLLKVLDIRGR